MRRLALRLAVAAGALLVLALAAAHLAASQIQSRLLRALGPRATVGAVSVGLDRVTVRDLRVAAAGRGAWPAADELRAGELTVRPGLRSLWSAVTGGPWMIDEVAVRDGYLSALRGRDGRLRLVPSLMAQADAPAAPAAASGPAVTRLVLGEVRVERVAVDLYDASLRGHAGAPYRVRFTDVDATVGPVALPTLDQAMDIDLSARLKGVRRDGDVRLHGTLTPATKDAELACRVKDVDLVALQPYLFHLGEGGVRGGTLDLSLDARVRRQHLHAPGVVTLTGLSLAPGGGPFGALGAGSRQAVIDVMGRDGRLTAHFTLDGRLDDPGFSLNENLATRVTAGLGDALGVGVQGVVQGMGRVLKGLVGR